MIEFPYPRELAFKLSRLAGGALPPNVISVARPHLLGNPFLVSRYGREQAVALHRTWLLDMSDADLADGPLGPLRVRVLARLGELRGVGFACWCSLPAPYARDICHRATCLEIANR